MTEDRILIQFRWLDPEGESAGDIEFGCECGRSVEREQVDIYDAFSCECGIRYKFHTEVYVEKVIKNAE